MRRVSRGKAWLIVFCAPLVRAATAALCINAITVPAHANHCTKRVNEYRDVMINVMNAAARGVKPMCPEYKKELAATTALKELSMQDCYHGKDLAQAGHVKN